MRNISSDFKQQLENGNRKYIKTARITFSDQSILNLTNENFWNNGMIIEEATSGDNSFDVGAVIIGQLTLTINNIYDDYTEYDFTNAKVDNVKVGIELEDGTEEYVSYGVYTVDETSYNGSIITLKCLDNIQKFDRPYSESNLQYPATILQIVQDACSVCGVALGTASFDFDNLVVNQKPTDEAVTFRNVLQWVGQISCCFFRADSSGRLIRKWYDTETLESINLESNIPEFPDSYHNIHSFNSLTVGMDDIVITGVSITIEVKNEDGDTESVTHQSGTTGYMLSISGNKLIEESSAQTIVTSLGEKLNGIRFRSFSASALSNPSYEAGDIAVVTNRKGNKYKVILTSNTFQPGNFQKISCGAETPGRKSATRYSKETQAYVDLRNDIKDERTQRELQIEALQNVLSNSSGMYFTEEEQPDGSVITYLHDKKNLSDSQNVIKITAEAIGISNDGGETYPYGLFLTGDLIARLLYVVGINADYINTGALSVKDEDGNTIFEADIDQKTLMISGDYIQIGGQNIADVFQELEEEINNSKNLSVILDSEFQTIPTDSDGNYETFPECKTTATVFYGGIDVTDQCIYQITESQSVTGTWNNASRTYTVTGLSADTGWVDIKATYLSTLSATRRFSISKQKQGEGGSPGEPGRVYFMEASAPLVKIVEEKTLSPNSLKFNAYYREGDDTSRKNYQGRFRIRETPDGGTWNTVYESSEDENEVQRYLYGVISDAEGNAISTAEGDGIAAIRKLQEIEVTLFASGGFETVIDIITIPVIQDVQALSQEDVFNLLTNNGVVKGIYMVGDELYINASYLVTGILTDLLGRNYWNLETGDFSLSASAKVGGKTVQEIANNAVDSMTQQEVFNKLTRNGEAKGIYMSGNELYINATYLAAGILADRLGNNYWNLESGEFKLSPNVTVGGKTIQKIADDAVDSMTQEEVFNKLTNNGALPGLYMYNNQLYINFSYGRGGVLKLGGSNNGNGELHVYDASGNEIGYWTKDGFYTKNGVFSGKITSPEITGGTISGSNISGTNISGSTINGGNISGAVITSYFGTASNGANIKLGYGRMRLYYPVNNLDTLVGSLDPSRIYYNGSYYYGPQIKGNGQIWFATDYGDIAYFLNDKVVIFQDFTVHGTKNRLVQTKNYGNRLQYCYETATPYFGDIGTGILNEDGECYISIDDIFSETVSQTTKYSVFLQKEGQGDIWVDSKEPTFFVAKGTPGLPFSWEIKAIQKDYEQTRLQDDNLRESLKIQQENDVKKIFDNQFADYEKEMEEMFS